MPDTWEGVICAEIDLGEIAVAKAAADPAGHYARADVMRLMINRAPNHRVHAFDLALQAEGGASGQAPRLDTDAVAEHAVRANSPA